MAQRFGVTTHTVFRDYEHSVFIPGRKQLHNARLAAAVRNRHDGKKQYHNERDCRADKANRLIDRHTRVGTGKRRRPVAYRRNYDTYAGDCAVSDVIFTVKPDAERQEVPAQFFFDFGRNVKERRKEQQINHVRCEYRYNRKIRTGHSERAYRTFADVTQPDYKFDKGYERQHQSHYREYELKYHHILRRVAAGVLQSLDYFEKYRKRAVLRFARYDKRYKRQSDNRRGRDKSVDKRRQHTFRLFRDA